MADMTTLLARRAELDAQISEEKRAAVQQVRDFMVVMGVTIEDLLGGPAPKAKAKRVVKYRDEHGNTWAGVGQRPRWLQARLLAGATLEQFVARR
jgi:DNA-binding protein H-NS